VILDVFSTVEILTRGISFETDPASNYIGDCGACAI